MKKIFTLISFVLAGFTASAQCDLPAHYSDNTGVNMTVMLTPAFISSITTTEANAYLVALTPDGLVVGSVVIGNVSQTSLAVWGDDFSTEGFVDGALANEIISLQLVDGVNLFDVEFPTEVSYTANGMTVQISAATVTPFCVPGCIDATANNYDEFSTLDDASCTYDTSSGTAIEYQLSAGWNMVGYTGTADNNGIVEQMNAALGNSAGTANTFQVIKNVSGQFWSAAYAQISTFNQGQGYMMYVNGATTSVNFQQTSGYISGIEYALSAGWNMVAFTGDVSSNTDIVSSMDAALGNAAGTANTFQVIKNVSGQFWSAAYAQINTFNPGQAYMMYVNGSTTTVNFQQ